MKSLKIPNIIRKKQSYQLFTNLVRVQNCEPHLNLIFLIYMLKKIGMKKMEKKGNTILIILVEYAIFS